MERIKKIHFIGVGGIGMSALAQYFKDQGIVVAGSDREESPVTELLGKKDIQFVIGQNLESIPRDADTVVYSDALELIDPAFMKQVRSLGIPTISYFEMLGEVSKGKTTVAVAGTHGKTTTTGMLAKILKDAGAEPTAIIGSLVKDFGSNYLRGDSDLFVVEACEYRDHLLELAPQILVLTNLEWDHTDWFPSLSALQETFRKAIEKVPEDGAIVTNPHDANIAPLLRPNFANGYEWAQQGYAGQARIVDYTQEPAYTLLLPGEFNQMNARAAAAAARVVLNSVQHSVLDNVGEVIRESLAHFQGTWRRFEYKGKTAKGADVYDDYAHHPTAVRETLRALRAQTAGRVIVAFHPHLYSRTRDLLDGFSAAFGDADKVIIAPIYSARETDDGSVSSDLLAARIRATGTDARALGSFAAIERALGEAERGDTIMTMGAGDIYKVADALVAK